MINRLTIQHYRSISNLDLSLGRINLLVGPNGTGKSNIIDALKFVRDALRNGLDHALTERHGIASTRQWSPTKPYHITISLDVSEDQYTGGSFTFTLGSAGDQYNIRREEGTWRSPRVRRRLGPHQANLFRDDRLASRSAVQIDTFHYTRDMDQTVTVEPFVDQKTQTLEIEDSEDFFLNSRYALNFRHLRSLLMDFESYVIFPNTLRQPEKQSNEIYLQTNGQNLAGVIKRMRSKKKNEAINEITSAMQLVLPSLEKINVQALGGFLTTQFLVGRTKSSHAFNVNQMSDGTLRILGLLVALYQQPRPRTIALEEPELTIHPGALKVIADSIFEVSQTNQVFITTHSPDLLDYFPPEHVIAVEMHNNNTRATLLRKSQVDAVKNHLFSLGELLSIEGLHGEVS